MNINVRLVFQRPRIDRTREPAVHSMDIFIPLTNEIRTGLLKSLNNTTKNNQAIFFLKIAIIDLE